MCGVRVKEYECGGWVWEGEKLCWRGGSRASGELKI